MRMNTGKSMAIIAFNLVENRIDNIRQQSASMMSRFFARLERLQGQESPEKTGKRERQEA